MVEPYAALPTTGKDTHQNLTISVLYQNLTLENVTPFAQITAKLQYKNKWSFDLSFIQYEYPQDRSVAVDVTFEAEPLVDIYLVFSAEVPNIVVDDTEADTLELLLTIDGSDYRVVLR
ncbi:hypothetical protein FACS1894196_2410 [Clostridia bacterium]|nr:hypothetical protein FACS1894196_2410 [Clostridia bacterium]